MTDLNGECPGVFLQETLFPTSGGFIDGRYCEAISSGNNTLSCCLPCPLADWRYADNIAQRVEVASWISVAILPLCVFILISYAVLAPKWTNRHYLSICFTLGICVMEIAFIIPLGVKPNQCYNEITPNDMYSDLSCAFSGSMLLFGGWLVSSALSRFTSKFAGKLSWGQNSCGGAFLFGFGIPAIGLGVMLKVTGVSFRFGEICHINIYKGLHDYWIPLMVFASVALILQVSTMAYCIHIYLRSLFDKSASTSDNSSGLPSYTASVRTVSARHAWRRMQRVLQLQWRGVTLVLIILGNVIFFAVVFIKLDSEDSPTAANMKKAEPWFECLAAGYSKKECESQAAGMGPNEATVLAMVYLLSFVGFWNFILFARPLMFSGWLDFIRRAFSRRHEFISADANDRFADDSKGFEMLTTTVKTPPPRTLQYAIPQSRSHGRSESRGYSESDEQSKFSA
ncbi:uncharacterized protein N7483_013135 [Penicillium malachiteum]|uniref:uncharacterized protein n=1 Tax=Penicillium malachiteum TaxID=1324776 RepID=UPI0025474A43|nr:uncharacterized protein N7483_013135 [Penicillium malachiteum]KAJ5715954.1 hypothetical protein N7483_013135 [Penicillium malachiteum]